MRINGITVPNDRFQIEYERLKREIANEGSEEQVSDYDVQMEAQNVVIEMFLLEDYVKRNVPKVKTKILDERLTKLKKIHGNEKRLLRKYNLKKHESQKLRDIVELNVRKEEFIESLVADVVDPTDAEIDELYRKNPLQFGEPERIRVSHIVKHTNDGTPREVALRIIKQAQRQLQGGADFGQLCRQYSDCKGQSGDLGWFPRGQMVQSFDDVVFDMEVGEISDVFETEFGFHIALKTGRKEANIPPLEEIRATLKETILHTRRIDVIDDFVAKLKEKATIEY